jgi:hypothetical protein
MVALPSVEPQSIKFRREMAIPLPLAAFRVG